MQTYIALLRGINVGGNNLIPMPELRSICTGLGYGNVRTYIQSGNVLFESEHSEDRLVQDLEQALHEKMERHIAVVIRSAEELDSVLSRNPFPDGNPSQVAVVFFAEPVPADLLDGLAIPGPEEVAISGREIYIHYPEGMGRSKLKLPKATQQGTARNINTVTKLAGLSKKQA